MTTPLPKPDRPALRTVFHNAGRTIALTWSVSPGLIIVRFVSALLTGTLPLLQAYLGGQLINALVAVAAGMGDVRDAYTYLLLSVVALGFDQGSRKITNYYASLFDDSFERALERRVLEHVITLDQSYYEDGTFTSLFTKVRENLYSLRDFVGQLTELLSGLLSIVGSIAILGALNPFLLLVVALTVVPLTIVEVRQNLQLSKFWDQSSDRWRLLGFLRWSLFGGVSVLKELKLYQAADQFVDRLDRTNAALDAERRSINRAADLGRFVIGIVQLIVDAGIQIWLIGRIVLSKGKFGVGDFQFYRGIIQTFSAGISSVAFSLNRLQGAFLYIGDYWKLMAYRPRVISPRPGVVLQPSHIPRLDVRDISFRYPRALKAVLSDVSFTLEPGERLAIVGTNGAGKTTLLKLLLRLYDPSTGEILVDGHPLQEINLESWYGQLGFLFQDFGQYGPLTIRENLLLGQGRSQGDRQRIERALAAADAKTIVDELPNRLEQVLDPSFSGGTQLSGGEWQRLALARSFYREPNILVLDEPTSAIDAQAEHRIFENLFRTHEGKSMIIVSHRFSTVRRAHKILVLEHGRMIEFGTHRELMAHRGRYRELFELQAEGYKQE